MGLRTRIAAWLRASAPTPVEARSTSAADAQTLVDVAGWLSKVERRVDTLELDRPAFVTALEEMAERCHDILDASESKRARIAAKESKLKKRDQVEAADEPALLDPLADRDAMKAQVRERLRALGKLH